MNNCRCSKFEPFRRENGLNLFIDIHCIIAAEEADTEGSFIYTAGSDEPFYVSNEIIAVMAKIEGTYRDEEELDDTSNNDTDREN